MSVWRGVGLVLVSVLISCCAFSAYGLRSGGSHVQTGTSSWKPAPMPGSVVLTPDGTALLYSAFPLGCVQSTATGQFDATGFSVRYTTLVSDQMSCASAPNAEFPQTRRIPLGGPIGGRPVIDALTGTRIPVYAQLGALHPRSVPAGTVGPSVFGYVASVVTGFGGAGSATLGEAFTTGVGRAPILWIVQTTGTWQRPPGVPTTSVSVRGHAGQAAPNLIEWSENGQTIAVFWQVRGDNPVPASPSLASVAASLVRTAVPA